MADSGNRYLPNDKKGTDLTETELLEIYWNNKKAVSMEDYSDVTFEELKVRKKNATLMHETNFLMCKTCKDLVEKTADKLLLHKEKKHPASVDDYKINPQELTYIAEVIENELPDRDEPTKIVYCLIDGRNFTPEKVGLEAQPFVFYVGMGNEDRPAKHFYASNLEKYPKNKKNIRIKGIWNHGSSVVTVQMGPFTMFEAARREAALIEEFRGQLTNTAWPDLDIFGLLKLNAKERGIHAVWLLAELLNKLEDPQSVGECGEANGWIWRSAYDQRAGGETAPLNAPPCILLPNSDISEDADIEDFNLLSIK